jgi:hypothetical protein
MFARVAVWEPMPADDRNWVVDAAATVPGVSSYHLVDPDTGNGLSVAFFEDEQAASAAQAAIEKRAQEIDWHAQARPRPTSVTFYQVLRSAAGPAAPGA